ncbi:MAG: TolC family protein [Alphaproteobacteria bacterium]
MSFYRYFFPALFIGAIGFVPAANLRAETLDQAVQATLQTHPSVTTAKVGSSVAEEQRREERSGYFPTVGISGQAGRIFGDNSTSRGLTTTRGAAYSNYWESSVTARQMIYDASETSRRVDSAQAKIESANMNIADVGERLAFSVAQAYVDLLRARTGLAMLIAHGKKVADYQARIKDMVDQGAADEAEHQQARDIGVILENMIAEYGGQVRMAEAYFAELTGALPTGELSQPVPRADLIPPSADEAIGFAKANHPALKSALLMSDSAAYDAAAEKAVLYPDLDGELSYLESEKDDVIGGEVTDARAVVRLNWEFETGGAQLARIEQKKLKEKESKSKTQEMERQVERALRLAYADYTTALQQADSQERRAGLTKTLFDTYNVQFEGARITLLQLMQSDNQTFTAQLEKMNGGYRVMAARYAILAGMGRLRESLDAGGARAPVPDLTGGALLTRPTADDRD